MITYRELVMYIWTELFSVPLAITHVWAEVISDASAVFLVAGLSCFIYTAGDPSSMTKKTKKQYLIWGTILLLIGIMMILIVIMILIVPFFCHVFSG